MKGIFDLHNLPFRPYFEQQFSICYDVYLQVREEVRTRTLAVLGRTTHNWRLRNACSACTYKLQGEGELVFSMLVTMDGNDSLKRILRKESDTIDSGGTSLVVGKSTESFDSRQVSGDYYLSREVVDRWAKDRLHEQLQNIVPGSDYEDNNPCATRWTNMINDMTSRMWSVFDETGIFLALCRHGIVLLVTDMVRSGEL